MRVRTVALMVTLLAVAGTGCQRQQSAPPAEEAMVRSPAGLVARGMVARSVAADAVAPATKADLAARSDRETRALPSAGWTEPSSLAMIVRTGNASLEVDSLEPAMALIRHLTAGMGGYVGNAAIQSGRQQVRQGTIQIKVPAPRFNELTAGLEPLGRVEYVNVSAEDVGEEFTDLTARATNARRLEARLIELLATRTGRLQDVLSVERELARVREEIERMEGRVRFLKSRSAMSELSVTLHEPLPILVDSPGRNPLAVALRQAWRNSVAVLAAMVAGFGSVAPVAGVLALGIFSVRRLRRRRIPAPAPSLG